TEGTAEDVAELVMQAHAGRAETGPGEPRGAQQVGARVGCAGSNVGGGSGLAPDQQWEGAGRSRDRLECETVDDRVGLRRVQRLDRVCERVDGAGDRHGKGKAARELDI